MPTQEKSPRISENKEIMEESQKWVEAEHSAKSPLQTLAPVAKNITKTDIKKLSSDQCCLISWYCFINFARDYSCYRDTR